MAQMIPNILFMIIGGTIADRINRKKLLLFTQSGMAVVTLIIAIFITVDLMTLNLFLAFNFIYGLLVALDIPARRSLVPTLVPKGDLANANALYAGTFQIALFLGPMIGSLITAHFGFLLTFYFNAVTFAGIIIAVALMNMPKEAERVVIKSSFWNDITNIGSILRETRIILFLIFVGLFFGAFGKIDYLIPPFVEEILFLGAVTTGVMNTFIGLGLIVGAVIVARFDKHLNCYINRYLILSSFTIGMMTYLLSIFKSLYILNSVLFIRSIALQIGATLILSSLQFVTDEKYMGRVMGVYSATLAVAGLSTVPITLIAERNGVHSSFMIISIGALLLFVFLSVMAIRKKATNIYKMKEEESKSGL